MTAPVYDQQCRVDCLSVVYAKIVTIIELKSLQDECDNRVIRLRAEVVRAIEVVTITGWVAR